MKSKLEVLFNDAVQAGYAKPTLRTKNFIYKQAPTTGRNPGSVYITSAGEYIGRIFEGKLLAKFMGPDLLKQIVETMNSPQEAAVRYGHQTGQCSICGRRLDNKISIALGIGPICNEKFGWTLPADYYDDSL